VHAQLGMG